MESAPMNEIVTHFNRKKERVVDFLANIQKIIMNISVAIQLEIDRQFDGIRTRYITPDELKLVTIELRKTQQNILEQFEILAEQIHGAMKRFLVSKKHPKNHLQSNQQNPHQEKKIQNQSIIQNGNRNIRQFTLQGQSSKGTNPRMDESQVKEVKYGDRSDFKKIQYHTGQQYKGNHIENSLKFKTALSSYEPLQYTPVNSTPKRSFQIPETQRGQSKDSNHIQYSQGRMMAMKPRINSMTPLHSKHFDEVHGNTEGSHRGSSLKRIQVTKNHQICQSLDRKIHDEAMQFLRRTQSNHQKTRSPKKSQFKSNNALPIESISNFTPGTEVKKRLDVYRKNDLS